MNKKLLALLFLIASFFVFGCGADGNENLTPSLPEKNLQKSAGVPVSVPAFTPPESRSIDEKKAKQYLNASAALLLLGEEWSSKIESAQGEDKVLILQNYQKAREQVCVRTGLAGLAEFDWITNVAMKDSSNADVFNAAGVRP